MKTNLIIHVRNVQLQKGNMKWTFPVSCTYRSAKEHTFDTLLSRDLVVVLQNTTLPCSNNKIWRENGYIISPFQLTKKRLAWRCVKIALACCTTAESGTIHVCVARNIAGKSQKSFHPVVLSCPCIHRRLIGPARGFVHRCICYNILSWSSDCSDIVQLKYRLIGWIRSPELFH